MYVVSLKLITKPVRRKRKRKRTDKFFNLPKLPFSVLRNESK